METPDCSKVGGGFWLGVRRLLKDGLKRASVLGLSRSFDKKNREHAGKACYYRGQLRCLCPSRMSAGSLALWFELASWD